MKHNQLKFKNIVVLSDWFTQEWKRNLRVPFFPLTAEQCVDDARRHTTLVWCAIICASVGITFGLTTFSKWGLVMPVTVTHWLLISLMIPALICWWLQRNIPARVVDLGKSWLASRELAISTLGNLVFPELSRTSAAIELTEKLRVIAKQIKEVDAVGLRDTKSLHRKFERLWTLSRELGFTPSEKESFLMATGNVIWPIQPIILPPAPPVPSVPPKKRERVRIQLRPQKRLKDGELKL